MKKVTLLLALIGMITLQSCTREEVVVQNSVDNDTIAEVFEINQGTNFTAANNYTISYNLNPSIYASDVVLVYRLSGTSNGNDVWEPLPKTYYFSNGDELDYTFDFSISDIYIYMNGTFLLEDEPAFSRNQIFRVVIVPGYSTNKLTGKGKDNVDFSDYNAVMQHYNIDESKIKNIR